MFVLMAVIVAVVGGIFGNFLREAAVRILDALGLGGEANVNLSAV